MNSGRNIVIVDDDPDVLELVDSLLSDAGYPTHPCNDADSCLQMLALTGLQPALALLDILMPVIDGHQLALALRQRMPQLPILFMTGFTRKQPPTDLEGAPTGVILKPFRPQLLLDEVSRLLGASRPTSS
jgi:CheY-like chemotaxis protein